MLQMNNGRCATFRVALSCVSCDLPACKKVCGFLGHTAKYGCHKCMKTFESVSFGQTDYSGFDRNNWHLRTGSQQRLGCDQILKEKMQSGTRSKEAQMGCRYSVLLHLPCFDPVRNTVIDLMHNLVELHFFGLKHAVVIIESSYQLCNCQKLSVWLPQRVKVSRRDRGRDRPRHVESRRNIHFRVVELFLLCL